MPAVPPILRPTVTFAHERGVRDGTSVRRSFGPDGARTTRTLKVPWAEQDDLVRRYLGTQRLATSGGSVLGLQRLVPFADPANNRLRYNEVGSITGLTMNGKFTEADGSVSALYDFADVELAARPVRYNVLDDDELVDGDGNPCWPDGEYQRYVEWGSPSPSVEYLQLPGGAVLMYVKPAASVGDPIHGRSIPFGVGKVLPVVEQKCLWRLLPFDVYNPESPGPWMNRIFGTETTAPLIGKVNKFQFFAWKPGQCLLSMVRPIEQFDAFGEKAWDIEFTFAICATKWNHKYFFSTDQAKAGFYLAGRELEGVLTYHDDDAIPDGYSIYDAGRLYDCFRVHDD